MSDLEDIRLKELDELTPEDKDLLRKSADDLTDEEKEVFKDVLTDKEPEKEEDKSDKDELPFKTKEELDKYIEETITSREEKKRQEEEEGKKRKEEEAKGDVVPKFFDPDYKAKDWNDAFAKALPVIEQHIFERSAKLTQAQKDKIAVVEKEFDQQLTDIRKNNPDIPKADSDEGKKFDTDMDNIVIKFKGVTDMNEAFEIYKATHTSKEEEKEERLDLSKKIGGSGPPKMSPTKLKYSDIHRKGMDELLSEDLSE